MNKDIIEFDCGDDKDVKIVNDPPKKENSTSINNTTDVEAPLNNNTPITSITSISSISQPEKPKNDDESLSSFIEEMMKSCPYKEIVLQSTEVVTSERWIKTYHVEGRVNKSLENELEQFKTDLVKKIEQKLGGRLNIKEFWKVTCGLNEGDAFAELNVLDNSGNKIKINHEPGTVLLIDVWSFWHNVDVYLKFKIDMMTRIQEGKVEGVDPEKVKRIGIGCEDSYLKWKSYISLTDLQMHIPQYFGETIYADLDITEIPSLIIVDQNGIVKYMGLHKDIECEQALALIFKNPDDGLLNKKKTNDTDVNPNAWFLDMDSNTKVDIVTNVNATLEEIGARHASFIVITDYTYQNDGTYKAITTPVFTGNIFEAEYEIIQNFAFDLQSSLNFTNFKFNIKVMAFF
jgi:hypothetical protein